MSNGTTGIDFSKPAVSRVHDALLGGQPRHAPVTRLRQVGHCRAPRQEIPRQSRDRAIRGGTSADACTIPQCRNRSCRRRRRRLLERDARTAGGTGEHPGNHHVDISFSCREPGAA
jgi:hypothetical protein